MRRERPTADPSLSPLATHCLEAASFLARSICRSIRPSVPACSTQLSSLRCETARPSPPAPRPTGQTGIKPRGSVKEAHESTMAGIIPGQSAGGCQTTSVAWCLAVLQSVGYTERVGHAACLLAMCRILLVCIRYVARRVAVTGDGAESGVVRVW